MCRAILSKPTQEVTPVLPDSNYRITPQVSLGATPTFTLEQLPQTPLITCMLTSYDDDDGKILIFKTIWPIACLPSFFWALLQASKMSPLSLPVSPVSAHFSLFSQFSNHLIK